MSQLKILVAEDETFQKLSIIDIFSLCNYDVEAVENGQQALDALRANPDLYDLVLLDIVMPIMVPLSSVTRSRTAWSVWTRS